MPSMKLTITLSIETKRKREYLNLIFVLEDNEGININSCFYSE